MTLKGYAVPAIYKTFPPEESPEGNLQEECHARVVKFSACKVGVQISCSGRPKISKKVMYGQIQKEFGKIIRQLCQQKEVELIEGHAMPDHIHLVLSVPPKCSIAMVFGYLKSKSAIHIHRQLQGVKKGFTEKHIWPRGYCVSTVGFDEETIRAYVKNQEELDHKQEVLEFDQ